MTIKIIYALLILLTSLAGCSGDKVSRQPTAKLSGGHEDNAPSCPKLCSGDPEGNLLLSRNNTPSDPLQVCSPAADLHTTESEEARERREYEDYKSDLTSKDTHILVILLCRYNPEPLRVRVTTDILVERLGCQAEEILYTFYNTWSSSRLVGCLYGSLESAEEKQTIIRILEDRGETIPETE
ncbi:MAG: hypothetical protein LBL16_01380 [Endomicrobium sp.]|jgi:hypothetical protein|nr:hypothetical protein [Endomicrobium sp.]